jgi:hypothetical protein
MEGTDRKSAPAGAGAEGQAGFNGNLASFAVREFKISCFSITFVKNKTDATQSCPLQQSFTE